MLYGSHCCAIFNTFCARFHSVCPVCPSCLSLCPTAVDDFHVYWSVDIFIYFRGASVYFDWLRALPESEPKRTAYKIIAKIICKQHLSLPSPPPFPPPLATFLSSFEQVDKIMSKCYSHVCSLYSHTILPYRKFSIVMDHLPKLLPTVERKMHFPNIFPACSLQYSLLAHNDDGDVKVTS